MENFFNFKELEIDLYKEWVEKGFFSPSLNQDKDNYSIVLPPPNVTGNLHMGHALNNTMQDILIRYKRMKDNNVLWLPGTDHAGIATQMVVERLLDKDGVSKYDLGREKFVEKVWEWKESSGGQIVNQQKRLGSSCDWSRSRFTLDDGLSSAVKKVFIDLYENKLIFKDKRLVNWDTKLRTAISDLEVIQKEVVGSMWYFKYPVVDSDEYIMVGTTRPETMLGDVAIAVNPEDERYTHLVGKNCIQPLTGKEIIIVADDYADMEQGTGAVKITPAHDFNDFEVGKRNNLELINILTKDGFINDNAPKKYIGMGIEDCRNAVIKDMDELGFFVKEDECVHNVPFGDRSGVVIEPLLTDQWYVDAKFLAKEAIRVVKEGEIEFYPKNWEKVYFSWMENIEPWCISRQLWWGHQIPAWYDEDGDIYVANSEEEAYVQAKNNKGDKVVLKRDEDVLDTWFSSALWPFSTMGWPEKTADFDAFYSTDVLVTGFDIIFFWVARMVMFGQYFTGKVPFKKVLVHALVLDENGQKMSKSKGNVVDPIELIEEFGSDAVRLALSSLATPGRDIKFSASRVEGARNFITKLWNAAKFCQYNGSYLNNDFNPDNVKSPINRWIISGLCDVIKDVDTQIETFRFSDISSSMMSYVRGEFCDWYLEFSKTLFKGECADLIEETKQVQGFVFYNIIKLMHPVIPFVTEEIKKQLFPEEESIVVSSYPSLDIDYKKDFENVEWAKEFIKNVRATRSELNVPASKFVDINVKQIEDGKKEVLQELSAGVKFLARVENFNYSSSDENGCVSFVVQDGQFDIPLGGMIDLDAERERLNKSLAKAESEVAKIESKLNNKRFIENAPKDVVEKDKEILIEKKSVVEKVKGILDKISGA